MALKFGTPTSLLGPAGASGVAGSQIYFGKGSPASTLGVANDVFFATDTSYIYQRASSGWPTSGTLLQGGMGLTGLSGASLYAAAGSPTSTNTAGKDGDFYLDLVAGEIYLHQSGAWIDEGYSIKGPQGIRGSLQSFGSGAPSISNYPNALVGDSYFDQSAGNLYFVTTS